MLDRNLHWDGCYNARNLGGLSTTDGRRTRRSAIVRADSLDHLTAAGWSALQAHGIRTIVDLRNDEELGFEAESRPAWLTTVHVPLDDIADTGFWEYLWEEELDGTPLLHRPFLERKPQRCAAAIAAGARAGPGGVVFHCGIGRDRTGIVALLLLALAGVAPEEIASDYELSNDRLRPPWGRFGKEDEGAWTEERRTTFLLARRQKDSLHALLRSGPPRRSRGDLQDRRKRGKGDAGHRQQRYGRPLSFLGRSSAPRHPGAQRHEHRPGSQRHGSCPRSQRHGYLL
jgi:protein tyrosine/serine phosphatase